MRDTTRSIDQWVAPPDVHVLDEANLGVEPPAELDQVHELVVVGAPDHDRVELEAGEERGGGGDALEHACEIVGSGQVAKALRLQRIEADREPMQPGRASACGMVGEQHAVGRHRQVADPRPRREPARPGLEDRAAAAARRR